MNTGNIKQIKLKLSDQWEKGRFYKALVQGDSLFPLEIKIRKPSSAEMVSNYDSVKSWVRDIRVSCEKNKLNLGWVEINHRQLGRNSIPGKITFLTITELAFFLGKKKELQIFETGLDIIKDAYPKLTGWVEAYPFDLINNLSDIERLLSFLTWRLKNLQPAIYLRQLSLPGVDTKFIENHRTLLGRWLDILLDEDQIDSNYSGKKGFEERYGFLSRPAMVRFRYPDSSLKFGKYTDMTVRADEFALQELPVWYVFIIENDITALSFPQVKDSLVIFGRGYNFDHLVQASWLNKKELWYWGDIDTHGFAILNQFRTCFPKVTSFLMDRETLISHRVHWGVEKTPSNAVLSKLNREELLLYDDLRSHRIEKNLRLEQEFIRYSRVLEVVGSIIK